jgi:4a-hydroxytetrahydrobiopterin dehydratase
LASNEGPDVATLAERRCIPCRGGVPPLTREQLAPLVAEIDEAWDVRDVPDERRGSVTILRREFGFKNFKDAMRFAARIGDLAEEQQHHPDLHVAWGKLAVEIWTHKIGGLTESDVVFAAKCDTLFSAASIAAQ